MTHDPNDATLDPISPKPQDALNRPALFDRLTHHCHIVETGNESYRFRHRSTAAKTKINASTPRSEAAETPGWECSPRGRIPGRIQHPGLLRFGPIGRSWNPTHHDVAERWNPSAVGLVDVLTLPTHFGDSFSNSTSQFDGMWTRPRFKLRATASVRSCALRFLRLFRTVATAFLGLVQRRVGAMERGRDRFFALIFGDTGGKHHM